MRQAPVVIGIDVGGTFTDFVVYRPETQALKTFKVLSTPHDPAQAVLSGLQRLSSEITGARLEIIHGSTVATNALLERRGAKTALVTTRGFKDVLEIGRQNRPDLYSLHVQAPAPLVPDELRYEADERVDHLGQVLAALDPHQAASLADELQRQGVQSAAVCLLFSFSNPAHEKIMGEALLRAGIRCSLSSEILPEFREYERTSTTVVNAYVTPVLDGYLGNLQRVLEQRQPRPQLRIMQSNGGTMGVGEAQRFGVRSIFSGPAGGVVGAQYVAELAQLDAGKQGPLRLITFDMGGTSTDVALVDGAPRVSTETVIGGCPIRIPVIDIHTIGAGGGSVARPDLGGALRVGPESAGADPGPACYGRTSLEQGLATVTDANLVLGRITASEFLGGSMPLDASRAWAALQRAGAPLGLDAVQTALGVIEVVNAHMERALRLISVERGYDPQQFTLLPFGGAGGLHACDLARRLGILRLLAPARASTLSALGMTAADIVRDYSLTVMLPGGTSGEELQEKIKPLIQRAGQDAEADGIALSRLALIEQVDMRYRGQSYELTVPLDNSLTSSFHKAHQMAFGYHLPEAELEIVNLRIRAVAPGQPPELEKNLASWMEAGAEFTLRKVMFNSGELNVPAYRWERLAPNSEITGPALVVRADTSLLVNMGDKLSVDAYGNLWVQIGGRS